MVLEYRQADERFDAYVNSIGIIAVIALCICKMIYRQRARYSVVLGTINCIVILGAIALGSIALDAVQVSHSQFAEGYIKSDKIAWTLYVGSNAETKGGWSEEDAKRFDEYEGESSIKEYHQKILIERYISLLSEPQKLFGLLKAKISNIWSCFTYPIAYSNETITNLNVREIYNHLFFKPLICLEYGMSVILAFIGVISGIKCSKMKETKFTMFLKLYMLGVTAMLLLTECNNKYTISLQTIYIAACLAMLMCKKNYKYACSAPASAAQSK